jgi:hypothetical protein
VCVLSTYNNLLFGNDLSNNVDDISKANRIATKLTGYDRGRSRPTTAVCVPFLSKSSRSRFWRNYDNTRQQYSPIQYRNQSKNTATHSVQKNNQWIRWVHIVSVILCLRFMSGLKLLLILRFYKLSQRIVLSSRQNPHNFLHQNNIHRLKDEYDLIQLEIDKLLSKWAISESEHSVDEFLSNIFLVPKKTGDLRPVINLNLWMNSSIKCTLKWRI